MSKKRRRQQRSFPWPILMFGGVILLAAAFLLASKPGAGSAGSNSDATGSPQIAADPAKIDYGYVKFGNNETFKIKVTNRGGGVLRFAEKPYIEVLEGC